MALYERRVLKSVEVLPAQSVIQVLWVDQVVKSHGVPNADDLPAEEVLSEVNFRKAYTVAQKDEFLREVDNASAYVTAVNW